MGANFKVQVDLYGQGQQGSSKIYRLVFPSPLTRILFRGLALILLTSITLANRQIRNLSFQILLDFFYLIPITIASLDSLNTGLIFACLSGVLRLILNPVLFASLKATDYVDFLVVTSFYLLDPLGIELLRRLAWQRRMLEQNLKVTTEALLEALQLRDHYTGQHSREVALYSRLIGEALGLTRVEQEELYLAGLLHDLGKIGIDDACLNKPGPLTPEEWAIIHQHPRLAYQIVKKVVGEGSRVAQAVLYHHERYDGRGYPEGLKGKAIPLEARILAVADCFDAMTTGRVYRRALTREQAIEELKRCAGTQFDPEIVDVFCRILERRRE